jgi:hypothetical protein
MTETAPGNWVEDELWTWAKMAVLAVWSRLHKRLAGWVWRSGFRAVAMSPRFTAQENPKTPTTKTPTPKTQRRPGFRLAKPLPAARLNSAQEIRWTSFGIEAKAASLEGRLKSGKRLAGVSWGFGFPAVRTGQRHYGSRKAPKPQSPKTPKLQNLKTQRRPGSPHSKQRPPRPLEHQCESGRGPHQSAIPAHCGKKEKPQTPKTQRSPGSPHSKQHPPLPLFPVSFSTYPEPTTVR